MKEKSSCKNEIIGAIAIKRRKTGVKIRKKRKRTKKYMKEERK